MKHGKKYTEAAKQVDRAVAYEPADAVALAKKTAVAKFDETIEVHIRTGCDGRHAEQQIRGAVVLPNGTGMLLRPLMISKLVRLSTDLTRLISFMFRLERLPSAKRSFRRTSMH